MPFGVCTATTAPGAEDFANDSCAASLSGVTSVSGRGLCAAVGNFAVTTAAGSDTQLAAEEATLGDPGSGGSGDAEHEATISSATTAEGNNMKRLDSIPES